MLHGLYVFCQFAICCENWVGFCVRNSVYHIYGSFYFSVSGFCMFLRVRGFVMGRPTEYVPLIIYLLMYIYKHVFMSFIFAKLQGVLAGLYGALLIIYITIITIYIFYALLHLQNSNWYCQTAPLYLSLLIYIFISIYTHRFYVFYIYTIPEGADFASRLVTTATIYIFIISVFMPFNFLRILKGTPRG